MMQNNHSGKASSSPNRNADSLPLTPIDVIYARYSTEMQNPKSCEDQERDVRDGLARKGFDPSAFELLVDRAESGTNADRPGFQRLLQLMRAKRIRRLAVDDQKVQPR